MKELIFITAAVLIISVLSSCGVKKSAEGISKDFLNNTERRESYVIGTDLAGMMKNAGDYKNEFSEEFFFSGFEDMFGSRNPKVSENEIRKIFSDPDSTGILIDNTILKGIITQREKQSYMIGAFHGSMMIGSPESFNFVSFRQGFIDELHDRPGLLDYNEMNAIREASRKRIERYHRNADISVSAEEKALINREFLIENSKREAVRTLKSGLQYAVIKEGKGKRITGREKVRVEYRGFFVDGREFDSSFEKGSSAEFSLEESILEGWKEGIQLMTVGSRYKFFVPPLLGYGEEGFMDVPPNSALIYDIELIEIIE
jgi:FKBP-type peptidyl-prolyl cis-trans isomerase